MVPGDDEVFLFLGKLEEELVETFLVQFFGLRVRRGRKRKNYFKFVGSHLSEILNTDTHESNCRRDTVFEEMSLQKGDFLRRIAEYQTNGHTFQLLHKHDQIFVLTILILDS